MNPLNHHFYFSYEVNFAFIYSDLDISIKEKLDFSLKSLRERSLITSGDHLQLRTDENYSHLINEFIDKHDLVVLLVSEALVSSKFFNQVAFNNLKDAHNLRKLRLIPVLVNDCDYESYPISKLKFLPLGTTPLNGRLWQSEQEAFTEVLKGIKEQVFEIKQFKEEAIRDRDKAQKTKELEKLNQFCKKYRFTKFDPFFCRHRNIILEKELWKDCIEDKSPEKVVDYLIQSKLKKHEKKAMKLLIRREHKLRLILEDLDTNQSPFLDLEFCNRYKFGFSKMFFKEDELPIFERIEKFMEQGMEYDEESMDYQFNAKYLEDRMRNDLSRGDWYNWQILDNLGRQFFIGVDLIAQTLDERRKNLNIIQIITLSVSILSVIFAAYVIFAWQWKVLCYLGIGLAIIGYYLWQGQSKTIEDLEKKVKRLKGAQKALENGDIRLKIAFLARDNKTIFNYIKNAMRVRKEFENEFIELKKSGGRKK